MNHHVRRAEEIGLEAPDALAGRAEGLRRATLIGRPEGSVHTGFALVSLDPGGWVGTHVHSTEQSFFVLEGTPEIVLDGRAYRLTAGDCGLAPVGVPHAWRSDEESRWLEMNAPAPRVLGPPDTFWTREELPPSGTAEPPDIRDPRSRTFFHLGEGQMDVDNLKVGAPVDAPTVSASMATAL